MTEVSHSIGFVAGGRQIYIAALMDGPDEEILKLFFENLGYPKGVESIADPQEKQQVEEQLARFLKLPRHFQAQLLAPLDALY